jgi:DNA-binding PadR family transcriptional regulator
MATLLDEGDRFSLTKLDIRILVALLKGQASGYEVARRCEEDAGDGTVHISNGTIQPALKSLTGLMLIKEQAGRTDGPGKPSRTFKITTVGRQVLDWESDAMKHQLYLMAVRSETTKKRP